MFPAPKWISLLLPSETTDQKVGNRAAVEQELTIPMKTLAAPRRSATELTRASGGHLKVASFARGKGLWAMNTPLIRVPLTENRPVQVGYPRRHDYFRSPLPDVQDKPDTGKERYKSDCSDSSTDRNVGNFGRLPARGDADGDGDK
jgi:hypothetical protein